MTSSQKSLSCAFHVDQGFKHLVPPLYLPAESEAGTQQLVWLYFKRVWQTNDQDFLLLVMFDNSGLSEDPKTRQTRNKF